MRCTDRFPQCWGRIPGVGHGCTCYAPTRKDKRMSTKEKAGPVNLDPCPFCGSESVEEVHERLPPTRAVWLAIRCNDCGSRGGLSLDATGAEAAEKWNRRSVGAK